MSSEKKKVFVVDDSEIDREILKKILSKDFDIVEASSGLEAVEVLQSKQHWIDAMIIDISMPGMSGFDVAEFMREYNLDKIPVAISTAEATRENVLRASELKIHDFIRKPFEPQAVLSRVFNMTGALQDLYLAPEHVNSIKQHMLRLENLFRLYLTHNHKTVAPYENIEAVMQILLERYRIVTGDVNLTPEKIGIISKCGFFCDVGLLVIPSSELCGFEFLTEIKSLEKEHPRLGREVVRLCHEQGCEFFVDTCTEICLHHHERVDGEGWPRGILGRNISVYSQFCHIAWRLDEILAKTGTATVPVVMAIQRLRNDHGLAYRELLDILDDCVVPIRRYYQGLRMGKM